MKTYKITTINAFYGEKFVRTINAANVAMALDRLRPQMAWDEIVVSAEEV